MFAAANPLRQILGHRAIIGVALAACLSVLLGGPTVGLARQRETRGATTSQASDSSSPKGELRLNGKFIKTLILEKEGEDREIVLDSPDATVLLPEGKYRWEKVTLASSDGSKQYSAISYRGDHEWFTVAADRPASLDIGGPLEPQLYASRHGGKVSLAHYVRGREGRTYNPEDADEQPKFTILHNGRAIGSGRFEYG